MPKYILSKGDYFVDTSTMKVYTLSGKTFGDYNVMKTLIGIDVSSGEEKIINGLFVDKLREDEKGMFFFRKEGEQGKLQLQDTDILGKELFVEYYLNGYLGVMLDGGVCIKNILLPLDRQRLMDHVIFVSSTNDGVILKSFI